MPCRCFRHAVGVVYVNGGRTRVNVVSHQIRGATSRACWLHRLRSQNLKVAQPNRTTERTSTPSGDRERPSLNRLNSTAHAGLSAAEPTAAMPNFCCCTGSFGAGPRPLRGGTADVGPWRLKGPPVRPRTGPRRAESTRWTVYILGLTVTDTPTVSAAH